MWTKQSLHVVMIAKIFPNFRLKISIFYLKSISNLCNIKHTAQLCLIIEPFKHTKTINELLIKEKLRAYVSHFLTDGKQTIIMKKSNLHQLINWVVRLKIVRTWTFDTRGNVKGTQTQIWKSNIIFVFTWK